MPGDGTGPILVTGANGHVGRRLLASLAVAQSGDSTKAGTRAVVRSRRASAALDALQPDAQPDIHVIDYGNANQLERALRGCRAAVHLVGVIKESSVAPFELAHERPCAALAQAARAVGIPHLVYLSIVGADADSENACLASRGRAEQILLQSGVPTTVLRVPMVIGRADAAADALRAQANSAVAALIGGGTTLQQPIDAGDVVAAIAACLDRPELGDTILELGGPECLSHRQLVMRAAQLYGRQPAVVPIPLFLMRALAAIMVRLSATPPITPAMLGVLQHDDRVDSGPARKRLQIELTPLDETLRNCVGPEAYPQ